MGIIMNYPSVLNSISRPAVLAGVIIFSLSGMAYAAGAGDQVGEHGSMTGQGGPISSGKDGSKTGEPSKKPKNEYEGAEREKMERDVEADVKRDKEHKLDPGKHTPSQPAY